MKILFVCTVNICRSALAEVILKKKLQEKGLTDIQVESAGVHNYAGEPYDSQMASFARRAGYNMEGYAKHATPSLLENADIIICMAHFHLVEVQKRLPYAKWNRIHLFNEICYNERTDLPDPSGDTDYMYHCVYDKIIEGSNIIVSKLSQQMSL